MKRRLPYTSVAVGTAIALAVSASPPARAQSIVGNPDKSGVVVLLAHSCLPHPPAPLGTTIAGVFVAAIPGTMARFECVGPDFREQSFTCIQTGVYDVVVAGAQGGKGPVEAVTGPNQILGGHEALTSISRGPGGPGGVVHGRLLLYAGAKLYIDVGQRGGDGGLLTPGGGGGGTFVLDAARNPIAVAGGGGGSGYDESTPGAPSGFMTDAQKLSAGQGAGSSGNGGSPFFNGGSGGGGAGFYADGQNGTGHSVLSLSNDGTGIGHADGGFSYANGLFGGYGGTGLAAVDYGGTGGFGGGGGAGDAVHAGGGGGGGGYAGGTGGGDSSNGNPGANYAAASLMGVTTASNTGDGFVTIGLER